MNNKNVETEEILSAIREMMGDDKSSNNESLPKDILDLTKKVEELDDLGKENESNDDVLELTNLVTEKSEDNFSNDVDIEIPDENNINIKDDDLKRMIRESIENNFSNKIDSMIKDEIDKLIYKKLSSIEVEFKENNKK